MTQQSQQTAAACTAAVPTAHATQHTKLKFNGSDRFIRELENNGFIASMVK